MLEEVIKLIDFSFRLEIYFGDDKDRALRLIANLSQSTLVLIEA